MRSKARLTSLLSFSYFLHALFNVSILEAKLVFTISSKDDVSLGSVDVRSSLDSLLWNGDFSLLKMLVQFI